MEMPKDQKNQQTLPWWEADKALQKQNQSFANLGIPFGSAQFDEALKRFIKKRKKHPEISAKTAFVQVLAKMKEEGLIKPIETRTKEKFNLKKLLLGHK